MDVKKILQTILGDVQVVDKKDSHSYSKKLDFNLYSKASYGEKIIHNQAENCRLPNFLDLGGSISINLLAGNNECCEVRCSQDTKLKEIFNNIKNFNFDAITICGRDVLPQDWDNTLEHFELEDGDYILCSNYYCGGGGDEFYIDDDLLDPSL